MALGHAMTVGEAIDLWPGLKRRPAVAVAALVSAQGRVVETGDLIERIYEHTGGYISSYGLRSSIARRCNLLKNKGLRPTVNQLVVGSIPTAGAKNPAKSASYRCRDAAASERPSASESDGFRTARGRAA